MTRKIYIIISIVIFLLLTTLSLSILQIIQNNDKISNVKSSSDLAKIILNASQKKDIETLKFWHCRPYLNYQIQSDFDQYLDLYISKAWQENLQNVTIDPTKSETFTIISEKGEVFKFETLVQSPSIFELKTKESLCFLIDS